MRTHVAASLAISVWLLACGGARQDAASPCANSASASGEHELLRSESARRALYQELLGAVRDTHTFSRTTERNLGLSWQQELAALEPVFVGARRREQLREALWRFGSALHDARGGYRPDERGARLRLPLRISAFGALDAAPEQFEFRVTELSSLGEVQALGEGDVVLEVDGVKAAELVRHHRNVQPANQWRAIALATAEHLTQRDAARSSIQAGDKSVWKVRDAAGKEKQVTLSWRALTSSDATSDFRADYTDRTCGARAPDYGDHQLVDRGLNYCVYVSREPAQAAYPVVYQWSFDYWRDDLDGQALLADQRSLAAALAKLKPKGVVLDLRDNAGGSNHNLVLDWWAPGPYVDLFTRVRAIPALKTPEQVDVALTNMGGVRSDAYVEALRGAAGARFVRSRPLWCPASGCSWDNGYTPAHKVTDAPLALLVGPGCNGSCAAFVLHFESQKWAPRVGLPTGAGYTSHRYRHVLPERLGVMEFAAGEDTLDDGGPSVEGLESRLDEALAPSYESARSYDAKLYQLALTRLRRGK